MMHRKSSQEYLKGLEPCGTYVPGTFGLCATCSSKKSDHSPADPKALINTVLTAGKVNSEIKPQIVDSAKTAKLLLQVGGEVPRLVHELAELCGDPSRRLQAEKMLSVAVSQLKQQGSNSETQPEKNNNQLFEELTETGKSKPNQTALKNNTAAEVVTEKEG